MRRRRTTRRSFSYTDTYWQQIVENRIPLVGAWFSEIAAVRLAESARAGSRQAAESLARALDDHPTVRVREIAQKALPEIESGGAWNVVWEVWLEKRSPKLKALLLEQKRSATHPPEARAYSHLLLGREDLLIKAGPDVVPALIEAASEEDAMMAAQARQVLAQMTQTASRQSFYEIWAEQRQPWQDELVSSSADVPQPPNLRVLALLRRGKLEALLDEGPESVPHLVSACTDPDARIAETAVHALRLLRQPAALDALCRLWVVDRSPLLEEIITQKGIIAGQLPEVRLRTALLIGRVDIAQKIPSQHLEGLLSAAADVDERIANRALEALTALTQAETREALCSRVIDQDDPLARQAALQAGCLPEEADRRALFLLLTGQLDAYAALDFDQRMMWTIFSAAPPELRKRIAGAVQAAGRIDFIPILTGAQERGRRVDWSEEEIRLLMALLTRERAWDRLWKLAFGLPLAWSIEAVRTLTEAGWQTQESDSPIFTRLSELAASLPAHAPSTPRFHLPVAVRAETLRVNGRVNDLAFSPAAPLLAIGTGQRSVVLWDFQKGEVETVLRGFEHSIGRVTFNRAGVLFIAERSSPDGPCDLSIWEGGDAVRIGRHERSITDVCPLGDERLLSVGNDRRIILWDLPHRQQRSWATLPYNAPRARRLMVSPDQQRVYYVHERISFFALPELNRYQEFYTPRPADLSVQRSTGRCAAILPPNGDIAVGQHNGQLVCYQSDPAKTYRVKHLLTAHDRQVQDVRWLPERGLIVSAGGEGAIRLTRWPGGEAASTLQTGMDWLTTLDVSADERFMATGSSDSSIALWDLRTDRLSAAMRAPLSSAQPADLTLLNAILAAEGANLAPEVAVALTYMQTILVHRLRFDIEVADLPAIRPGAFDIQLDEVAPKNE